MTCLSLDNNLLDLHLKELSLKEGDRVPKISDGELLEVQINAFASYLLKYEYDLGKMPEAFISQIKLHPERVTVIDASQIHNFQDSEGRLLRLREMFSHAKIISKIQEPASAAPTPRRPTTPEPLRLDCTSRENYIAPHAYNPDQEFLPIGRGSTPFDILSPRGAASTLPAKGRRFISELRNSSVSEGLHYWDGEKFTINRETEIGRGTKESDHLEQRAKGHFSTRLALFHVSAIACYKAREKFPPIPELVVARGETIHQIGRGYEELGMVGAHSALIPNLEIRIGLKGLINRFRKDEDGRATRPQLAEKYHGEILNRIKEIASALNVQDRLDHYLSATKPPLSGKWKDWFEDLLSTLYVTYVPIESELGQNLASTVCLPGRFNYFDELIEHGMRDQAAALLTQVFRGERQPIEVCGEFLKKMEETLVAIRETSIQKMSAIRQNCDLLGRFFELASEFHTDSHPERLLPKLSQLLVLMDKSDAWSALSERKTTSTQIRLGQYMKGCQSTALEVLRESPEFMKCFPPESKDVNLRDLPVGEVCAMYLRSRDALKQMLSETNPDTGINWEIPPAVLSDPAANGWKWLNCLSGKVTFPWKLFFCSKKMPFEKVVCDLKSILDLKNLESRIGKFRAQRGFEKEETYVKLAELYLDKMKESTVQLELLLSNYDKVSRTRRPLDEAEIIATREKLIKPKHRVDEGSQVVCGTAPESLDISIYYIVERVPDAPGCENGLKISIDKPQYRNAPYFKQMFLRHVRSVHGSQVSMKIGDKLAGVFWI